MPAFMLYIVASTDLGKAVAVVDYAFAAFSDNCPGATAVCLPPSGIVFPLGVSTVTCTAQDAAGNTAACSFTVRQCFE
jgi:HYR domain